MEEWSVLPKKQDHHKRGLYKEYGKVVSFNQEARSPQEGIVQRIWKSGQFFQEADHTQEGIIQRIWKSGQLYNMMRDII